MFAVFNLCHFHLNHFLQIYNKPLADARQPIRGNSWTKPKAVEDSQSVLIRVNSWTQTSRRRRLIPVCRQAGMIICGQT